MPLNGITLGRTQTECIKARSSGLVVDWMDLSDASYYIKEKLKIKVAKWGTSKKVFKKMNALSK
jgi:hypothetical protein